MNILLLGSGGREHAIAWALKKSPKCDELYVAPGNGGTSQVAKNVDDLDGSDPSLVVEFCRQHDIELVVVGPEAPLVAGVADVLLREGIRVFGPNSEGAKLEGSKSFAKAFMERANIPTASYKTFVDAPSAIEYVHEHGAPVVVKADGLAAGKGVVVASTIEEAEEAINNCFDGGFGEAGKTVVIEDCMTGPECSLLAFVTNGKAFCMAAAQDHKRAFDGDKGPNTGGMGVYSPVPIVTDEEDADMKSSMAAAAKESAGEDFPLDYRGVLYGGFMLTPQGAGVIEFNVRFGDPETQVILPRLQSDLVDIMVAVADGDADAVGELAWSDKYAVCVVLASQGYPGSYEKGKPITGIENAEALGDVIVFHAGTKEVDGQLLTNGGRVLNVVGMADTFEAARNRAYEAVELIDFEGKQFRTDIGLKALNGRSSWE